MANQTESPLVVLRCDASARIGFGHATRCLALAGALRDRGFDTLFAMVESEQGARVVREHGHRVELAEGIDRYPTAEGLWLEKVTAARSAALVLDVRTALPLDTLRALRARGVIIVTLDDPSARRLLANLAFYPPVPQVERMDWTEFSGELFVGWEWIPLRPEVLNARQSHRRNHGHGGTLEVIVSMGGSDPGGLTLLAVEALELIDDDMRVRIVLGPGFRDDSALTELLSSARREYHVLRSVADLSREAVAADIAIAAFGVTAYELAALGVPAVHLCLTADHAASASALERAGAAISAGAQPGLTPDALSRLVKDLLRDSSARARMGQLGRALIDGLGAQRIANVVAQHTVGRHSVDA